MGAPTRLNRRAFVARSLAAGGALVAGSRGLDLARAAAPRGKPNILVIMVDQLRVPMWFPDQRALDRLLPNIARLRSGATSFENHYTAANMCVAARGVLVTGLYPHQTGVMLTKEVTSSTLSPKFPTYGTLLRDEGYATTWYGKWHLGDTGDKTSLAPYAFDGGTYPSPNGNPGAGGDNDPKIVDQFLQWLDGAPSTPWCTTVSLVNPHDINWFPNWTVLDEGGLEPAPDYTFAGGPPNTETKEQLQASKPRLQVALQDTTNVACGVVPDSGPLAGPTWARMLKMYLLYHQMVDTQIGRVLDALAARRDLAANTVVVFTSDHGEYAGSHGLRAKGGGAYDEAIRVPLYIVDPRGYLSTGATSTRRQLTSSADFAALLLTIGHESASWRQDSRYAHLARRADLAEIARNPSARGRPWIAHLTDETTVEEFSAEDALSGKAPHHVAAVRTGTAKYAEYSRWKPDTTDVDPSDVDRELYDYATARGRLELDNVAGRDDRLQRDMAALLAGPVTSEVRAPLPDALKAAHDEGMADYYKLTADLTP